MSYPVRYHNHAPRVHDLSEYHEARQALDRLVQRLRETDAGLTQDGWIDMAADMASTNVYADTCARCREMDEWVLTYPYKVERRSPGNLVAYYVCPIAHCQWTCGWAVDAPLYI